ncbi:putative quinol monooxygenase [Neisseria sp. Ec49-e6-T10]|uniref:putative quinol monooxygenase n=1 Tax=Neisseria sp. Ec49-e6-T10 TaxID=3140744 RepID=UPI003EBC7A02
METKIALTVLIRAKPERAEELKVAILALIEQTIKEPGCEVFKVFQHHDHAELFTLWEVFSNQLAMQEHMQKDYTKKYFALDLVESVLGTQHIELTVT